MRRIVMFHKPKAVVVSRRDERGRKTVYDLLPAWVRDDGWVPVGRLDRDSRGLLLFVREGRLVELLTRPGSCRKVYEVELRGRLTTAHLEQIRRGIPSPVGTLTTGAVREVRHLGSRTTLTVELDEGKNRHLRRLFGGLADPEKGTPLKVRELKRVGFGGVALDLPSGRWRFLTDRETAGIQRRSAASPPDNPGRSAASRGRPG